MQRTNDQGRILWSPVKQTTFHSPSFHSLSVPDTGPARTTAFLSQAQFFPECGTSMELIRHVPIHGTQINCFASSPIPASLSYHPLHHSHLLVLLIPLIWPQFIKATSHLILPSWLSCQSRGWTEWPLPDFAIESQNQGSKRPRRSSGPTIPLPPILPTH